MTRAGTGPDGARPMAEGRGPPTRFGEERRALERFIDGHLRQFIGRTSVLESLTRSALSRPGRKVWGVCIYGEPGIGKSALFARLYKSLLGATDSNGAPILVLAHAAGIDPPSLRVEVMVERWIEELASLFAVRQGLSHLWSVFWARFAASVNRRNRFPEDRTDSGRERREDLRRRFGRLLFQAAGRMRVVVLVDGLDQLERTDQARRLGWLPDGWPANARFIATARPGEETAALQKREGAKLLHLPPLSAGEAEALVRRLWRRRGPLGPDDVMEGLVGPKLQTDGAPPGKPAADGPAPSGNPLWLTIAVDHLSRLDARQAVDPLPRSLDGLLRVSLEAGHRRLEEACGVSWSPLWLDLVAAGRFGMSQDCMRREVRGEDPRSFDGQFEEVCERLGVHLHLRPGEGLWDFRHSAIRRFLRAERLSDPARDRRCHRRILEYLTLGGAPNPFLTRSETLYHYFWAGNPHGAAAFLAGDLDPEVLRGATLILAELIAGGEQEADNPGLAWVTDLFAALGSADPSLESLERFCVRMGRDLDAALAGKADSGTRIFILEQVKQALENGVIQEKEDGVRGRLLLLLSEAIRKIGDLQDPSDDPWEARRPSTGPGTGLRRAVHRRAVRLRSRGYNRALAHIRQGERHRGAGDPIKARKQFLRALDILKKVDGMGPYDRGLKGEFAAVHTRLGDLSLSLGEVKAAEIFYKTAFAVGERIYLRHPEEVIGARDLAGTFLRLADLAERMGDLHQADAVLGRGIRLRQEVHRRRGEDLFFLAELADAFLRRGRLRMDLGRYAEAGRDLGKALAFENRIREAEDCGAETLRDLARSHLLLGDLHRHTGSPREAAEAYETGRRLLKETGACALRDRFYPDLADAHVRLGRLCLREQDPKEALRHFKWVRDLREQVNRGPEAGPDTERALSEALIRLGQVHQVLEEPGEADSLFRRALKIREGLAGRLPQLLIHGRDLAAAHEALGDLHVGSDALAHYGRALKLRRKLVRKSGSMPALRMDLAVLFGKTAAAHAAAGNDDRAAKHFREGLALFTEIRESMESLTVFERRFSAFLIRMADHLEQTGRADQAIGRLEEALELRKRAQGRAPRNQEVLADLAEVIERLEKLDRRGGHLTEGDESIRKTQGDRVTTR